MAFSSFDLNQVTSPSMQAANSTRSEIRRIARCRVIAELGQGGMANVYLAVQHGQGGVDKLVVLKALRKEFEAEQDALTMFLDEARVAAQLNHPNVVQTYEIGAYGDRHVMVMEYLEGQSFAHLLRMAHTKGRPLALASCVRIIMAVLDGLHYAHELSSYDGKPLAIVHRDVSPQNVFVTYSGQVKVLDFGIAKAASSSTETAVGVVKGKLRYMAPEQLMGGAVDRRADLFSVGCMLWAIVAGQKLWEGASDVEVMRHLVDGVIPSPLSVNPEADRDLVRIIEKTLAKNPADRYSTALELEAALEGIVDRLGPPVREKDIGNLVAELFAEPRAKVRAVVEAQLKVADFASEDLGGVPLVQMNEAGRSTSNVIAAEMMAREKGRRWPLILAGVGVCLVAGLLLARGGREPQAAPVAPVSPAAAAAPAVPDATPKRAPTALATIQFKPSPSEAVLYLDGVALAHGTRSKVLPLDGKVHELRGELAGHESARIEFTVSGDAELTLALEPTTSRTPTAARPINVRPRVNVGTRPAQPGQPARPTGAAAADCSNPFFIDPSGIKRVRTECK
jgi:serine/threonine-protein kinase